MATESYSNGISEDCGSRVSVSIVVHRSSSRQLLDALGCVLRTGLVGRVYVIDNSPEDSLRETVESVGTHDGRIRYLFVENRGFGAGHNVAIREAMAEGWDYHIVMNADVWWEGDVIGMLTGFMDASPKAGMVMPRVIYPDGKLQYACRLLPTPLDVFAKRFLPASWTRKRMRRYLLADVDHRRVFNPPYLLGSFLFFRMEALERCGLFDERFFMYPEDIDITRRVHRIYQTLFFPGAEIVHEHAAASRKSLRMLRIHIVNMIRYFNKWGWLFDAGRRQFNSETLRVMPRAGEPEEGRG